MSAILVLDAVFAPVAVGAAGHPLMRNGLVLVSVFANLEVYTDYIWLGAGVA